MSAGRARPWSGGGAGAVDPDRPAPHCVLPQLDHEIGANLHRIGGPGMIERNERRTYWRHTKAQMLTSLLPFVLAMIVLPLYADTLNDKRILGMPLGYFLMCHGLIVIAFVTIAVFVNRQDAIDRWHGAHEDF